MKRFAIITGDLVSSRKIAPGEREQLYNALDAFAQSLQKKWIGSYDRFRGDSLQCDTVKVKYALRAALLIRSFVMAYKIPSGTKKETAKGYTNTQFDIRLAVGIGPIDYTDRHNLSRSDGVAFERSGAALDSLQGQTERMSLQTGDEKEEGEWNTILSLLDAVAQKWTQNGAELVLYKLQDKKDEEMAHRFGISTSAITQRKKNAQWHAINRTIEYFEAKFEE